MIYYRNARDAVRDTDTINVVIPYSPDSFEGIARDTVAYLTSQGFAPERLAVFAFLQEGDVPPENVASGASILDIPSGRRILVVNGGTPLQGFALAKLEDDVLMHINVQRGGVQVLNQTMNYWPGDRHLGCILPEVRALLGAEDLDRFLHLVGIEVEGYRATALLLLASAFGAAVEKNKSLRRVTAMAVEAALQAGCMGGWCGHFLLYTPRAGVAAFQCLWEEDLGWKFHHGQVWPFEWQKPGNDQWAESRRRQTALEVLREFLTAGDFCGGYLPKRLPTPQMDQLADDSSPLELLLHRRLGLRVSECAEVAGAIRTLWHGGKTHAHFHYSWSTGEVEDEQEVMMYCSIDLEKEGDGAVIVTEARAMRRKCTEKKYRVTYDEEVTQVT